MKRARGLTIVEFAVVLTAAAIALFGAIEFSRLLYTYALAGEGARRGARLAVVCPVNDDRVLQAAAFEDLGIAPSGLTRSNVTVEYLDDSGAPVADLTKVSTIRAVRVRVSGVAFDLNIPFLYQTITLNESRVTLPRESLGYHAAGVSGAC